MGTGWECTPVGLSVCQPVCGLTSTWSDKIHTFQLHHGTTDVQGCSAAPEEFPSIAFLCFCLRFLQFCLRAHLFVWRSQHFYFFPGSLQGPLHLVPMPLQAAPAAAIWAAVWAHLAAVSGAGAAALAALIAQAEAPRGAVLAAAGGGPAAAPETLAAASAVTATAIIFFTLCPALPAAIALLRVIVLWSPVL